LEIKSGYGLSFDAEIKMLKAASGMLGPQIVSTYLGPHAVPVEHKNSKGYLDEILDEHLPKLKKSKLTCRLDMFVEAGYFDMEDAEKYVMKAKELGFELTFHADQITRTGASEFGARIGARSVDHVIQINDSDVQILAESETTAVLLPIADMYLKCNYPPARKLIDAGARVAIATDFNPGTSPSQDLSLVGLLSRLEMKMTLPEVLAAYTLGSSYALGLQDHCGSLEIGKRADFVSLGGSWRDLFYQIGHHPVDKVWVGGKNLKLS
jgi:imidazolonepropionase